MPCVPAVRPLLTDLTALDYDALERTLEFLANNNAAVAAQALPGRWNAASGTTQSRMLPALPCRPFFNVSPTEAQALVLQLSHNPAPACPPLRGCFSGQVVIAQQAQLHAFGFRPRSEHPRRVAFELCQSGVQTRKGSALAGEQWLVFNAAASASSRAL